MSRLDIGLIEVKGGATMHFPVWLNDSIQSRFDEHIHKSHQEADILRAYQQFHQVFNTMMTTLNPEQKKQFFQLEEAWNHLHVLEKEWLFKQGLKDGIQLIHALSENQARK
ncbi:hypothetical protein [Marinicrinis sediminis]|uniref:Uncharacterized protein n=1 Tax=Marinicrinis sediminis TaxID=1652465 RepID=A0ABW5R7U4_9BACL